MLPGVADADTEGLAGAGRVALVGAAVGAAVVLVALIGRAVGPSLVPAAGGAELGDVVLAVLGALAAVLAYRAAVRRIERRVPDELPRGGFEAFGTGAFITAGVMGAVLVILWLLGVYQRPQDPPRWDNVPLLLGTALLTAVGLQLLLQGVVLRAVERVAGGALGAAASVALFAVLAALGGDARDSREVVGAALGLGVLTACAYLASRDLWLPIGLHAGYLLVEGLFLASGPQRVLPGRLSGPPLLSGGGHIDASLALAVPLLVLGLGLLARARLTPET